MTVQEWLGEDNQIGIDIWEKKYRQNDESFDDWIYRVSGGDEDVSKLILDKKFLFGGRILANRGMEKLGKKVTMSNCYVLPTPKDSIESIFQCASEMARTFSYGGGVGIDLSKLSPNGAKINNSAKQTTGAVSFMDLYSLVSEKIGQGGRRGALMLSLGCEHPDLEEFITVKSDLDSVTKANISVRMTDDFMVRASKNEDFNLHFYRPESDQHIEKTINAKDMLMKLAEMNWNMGEPGVLFWDQIEKYNLLDKFDEFEYAGVNPCLSGSTLVLTNSGYHRIDSLVGKNIKVWNGKEFSNVTPEITGFDREMVRVKTANGLSVDCTLYHKFVLTNGERVEASDLQIGDKVTTYRLIPKHPSKKYLLRNSEITTIESVTQIPNADKVYCFNEPKLHQGVFNGILTGQCGEEPLPSGGSCLLGNINLAEFVKDGYFDFKGFKYTVTIGVKALNDVLDEGIELHPLKIQRDTAREWRQIGLGIFGLADMLIKLGIEYGSEDSITLCNNIGTSMADTAIYTSAELAKQYNPFPKCDNDKIFSSNFYNNHPVIIMNKNGLRNSQLLTIAPTGSLSTMLGVSGGIEPIYDTHYMRKTESLHGEDKYYKIYTPIVKEYMEENSIDNEDDLPDYFITSKQIDPINRIKMQAVWQNHIDASISSTVNLPEKATVEDIFNVYIMAYLHNLKGITVFRDNCDRAGILTSPDEPKLRGEIKNTPTNAVGKKRKLITGCGSLHCLAYFDPNTGDLLETYLNKGSTGGCNNFMIGLSRMLSLAARAGATIESVVDQLKSTGSCPSYAVRKATKGDVSLGSCCPMAIGNALIDMHTEMMHELKIIITDEDENNDYDNDTKLVPVSKHVCPECGSPIAFEGGCITCKSCGYSKCS